MSSDDINKDNVFIATKSKWNDFDKFKNDSLNQNNHLSFFPVAKTSIKNNQEKIQDFKTEKDKFFGRYNEACANDNAIFLIEKELANYLKLWLSTEKPYVVSNNENKEYYQDDFFNEENIESNIFSNNYIKNNYDVCIYELIFFVLEQLEKQMFDSILMNNYTKSEDKTYTDLKGPILENGLVELILKNDIEEKLNTMYKVESIGYSYIVDKVVTMNLFIIYLILKNFPFYVLRRSRLEVLFNSLKKFKSFPHPIGSIGMDIFKLLINELYLPGVSLVKEIRETFFLDIIDPKLIELDPEDFIKVISFDESIIYSEINNKSSDNQLLNNANLKLNGIKNFTFTALGVYSAYILYSCEDKKENDREEQYLENILALFEKRFKQKKQEENLNIKDINNIQINISEKNIINNLFNLMDKGLDSNFSSFIKQIKAINSKFISKSKETHETTTTKPRDNINLRKFFIHKINYIKLGDKPNKIFNKQKCYYGNKKGKNNDTKKINIEMSQRTLNNKKEKKGKKQKEEVEIDDPLEIDTKARQEMVIAINHYRDKLDEESKIANDEIIKNYINNFVELKLKYFNHLKTFDLDAYNYSDNSVKIKLEKYNKTVKIKGNQLFELYNQKYIVREDQLINFIKHLEVWKSNIVQYYHKQLYEDYTKSQNIEDKKQNTKNPEKRVSSFEQQKHIYLSNMNLNPNNTNEIGNISKTELEEEKKRLETLIKTELPFNYKVYLLPGKDKKNSLTKYISKQDIIYKRTIGDFFGSFNWEDKDPIVKQFTQIPLQLYLREAKHTFNLKLFKVHFTPRNAFSFDINDPSGGNNPPNNGDNNAPNNNENMIEKIYKNLQSSYSEKINTEDVPYYYMYGSIHIKSQSKLQVIFDHKDPVFFTNGDDFIYMDIINIYDETTPHKINDIEKYLVNSTSGHFQVFISGSFENTDKNIKDNQKCDYFKKFVSVLLKHDSQSVQLQAKHIKVIAEGEYFELCPVFITSEPLQCKDFEIVFDKTITENKKTNNTFGVFNENENRDLIDDRSNERINQSQMKTIDLNIMTFTDLLTEDQ